MAGTIRGFQAPLMHQTSSNSSFTRLHQLDGLRAIACLLVLAAHSLMLPTVTLLRSLGLEYLAAEFNRVPQSGVELFYVLSGIVLLRPYVRGRREFDVALYVRRRAERLLPPYWTCLLASVPLLLIAGAQPTWYSRQCVPAFHFSDLVLQAGIVSFTSTVYNGAWWSLQVEVMFYLLVPLLVYVMRRPRIGWAPLVAAAVVALILSVWGFRCLTENPMPGPVTRTLLFLAVYSPCFLMGTVIARFDFERRGGLALLATGIAAVMLMPFVGGGPYPAAYSLVYGGILTLALQPQSMLERGLSHPLLVWLGERSYSLFLIHCAVFYATNYGVSLFCADRSLAYGLATRLIGIPLSFLAAMVLFHFVERPFARGLVTADHFWPFRFVSRHTAPGAVAQPEALSC
jgi:peptidoglycan/LPS O-acetylase OafA/YrhL